MTAVNIVLEQTNANFQLAALTLSAIEVGKITLARLAKGDAITFHSMYCDLFEERFKGKDAEWEMVRVLLEVLFAATTALTSEEAVNAASIGLSGPDVRRKLASALSTMSQFFPASDRVPADSKPGLVVFHKSLFDWATDEKNIDYGIVIENGHKRLAAVLLIKFHATFGHQDVSFVIVEAALVALLDKLLEPLAISRALCKPDRVPLEPLRDLVRLHIHLAAANTSSKLQQELLAASGVAAWVASHPELHEAIQNKLVEHDSVVFLQTLCPNLPAAAVVLQATQADSLHIVRWLIEKLPEMMSEARALAIAKDRPRVADFLIRKGRFGCPSCGVPVVSVCLSCFAFHDSV